MLVGLQLGAGMEEENAAGLGSCTLLGAPKSGHGHAETWCRGSIRDVTSCWWHELPVLPQAAVGRGRAQPSESVSEVMLLAGSKAAAGTASPGSQGTPTLALWHVGEMMVQSKQTHGRSPVCRLGTAF